MNSRVIPALLCAAAIAFACGPHPQGTAQSVTTAVAAPRPSEPARVKQGPVVTSSVEARVGERVTFALTVTNRGPKLVELTFPTGQTHDFAVLDAAGREVWRWSRDRMFTQALQNRQLAGREAATFEETMAPGALHGTYTLVATLLSATHPVTERTTFTLP